MLHFSSAFALIVGMFLIYNAYAIAVAQRRGEIGLLRALGATRGQVRRVFAAAGCPPSEILLVDDARTNLMAAEKHGWRVLWFDDYRPEESIGRIKDALELAEE